MKKKLTLIALFTILITAVIFIINHNADNEKNNLILIKSEVGLDLFHSKSRHLASQEPAINSFIKREFRQLNNIHSNYYFFGKSQFMMTDKDLQIYKKNISNLNLKVCNLFGEIVSKNLEKTQFLVMEKISALENFKKNLHSLPTTAESLGEENLMEIELINLFHQKNDINSKLKLIELNSPGCEIIDQYLKLENQNLDQKNIINIIFIMFFLIPFLLISYFILIKKIKFN